METALQRIIRKTGRTPVRYAGSNAAPRVLVRRKMYIFPGRLIRAALRRIQTYGRKTVIHTITKENLKSSQSLSWNEAGEWGWTNGMPVRYGRPAG